MDFSFNEDQRIIAETVRDFASTKLEAVAEKMDVEDYWPHDLFQELGELGLLGPTVDEEYGGAASNYITQSIILEELARVSPAFALSIGAHSNLVLDNLNRNGTPEQKAKYLPKLVSGEWLGSLALTEPGAGSDAFGMRTTARREGDYYYLNGSKTFITNAPYANLAIVYAKTNPELKTKGVTAFLVELDSEGVSRGKAMDKMGMRGSKTGELFFEETPVPIENVIGIENAGFKIVMSGLSTERAVLSAVSLGNAIGAAEIALKYANEREQFGEKITNFQMVQDKIANIYVELQASKLLVYWSISRIQQSPHANKEAATAIYYAAEKSTKIALDAIQIMGGYGYMKEYKVEKFARDAKLLEIGAGTSEIRKLIIARDVIKNLSFQTDW